MNATRKSWVPVSITIMLALGACSKSDESPATAPLVTAASQNPVTPPAIRTQAGGISTSYTPYFRDEQLVRITEERVLKGGESAAGDYRYQGARLLRYDGTALGDSDRLSVEFNLQGALIAARKADAQAPEGEISEVRSRAQLLRSLALAQHATTGHEGK